MRNTSAAGRLPLISLYTTLYKVHESTDTSSVINMMPCSSENRQSEYRGTLWWTEQLITTLWYRRPNPIRNWRTTLLVKERVYICCLPLRSFPTRTCSCHWDSNGPGNSAQLHILNVVYMIIECSPATPQTIETSFCHQFLEGSLSHWLPEGLFRAAAESGKLPVPAPPQLISIFVVLETIISSARLLFRAL